MDYLACGLISWVGRRKPDGEPSRPGLWSRHRAARRMGNVAMKRLALLVFCIGLSAGWSLGDEPKASANRGPAGDWQGILNVTPQINLRITLGSAQGKGGGLRDLGESRGGAGGPAARVSVWSKTGS